MIVIKMNLTKVQKQKIVVKIEIKVLFTGYFELKAKLKKEKYKEEIMKNFDKYPEKEQYIIRTCLLPSAPFNEVMKFCVI